MNFNRIWAMILRDFYSMRHSLDRLSDIFYWPVMDLFVWGLLGLYFARLNPNNSHAVEIILTGMVFWSILWRTQYEINVNLLSEISDRNLVNVFSSPLKIEEWAISVIIFSFFKMLASLIFISTLASILYQYSIFMYGFFILPIAASLILTGWTIGFLVSGLIIRYGAKIQALAWTGAALLAPFSAFYYPLSILPVWAQKVAFLIPPSYMFEGMRQIIFTGTVSYDKFVTSFLLNFIYLALSILFFRHMFNRSKKLGLGRLI